MWIGHRKEIRKLTFRALALRRSESETSAFESLCGGQFTLSTQVINSNYLVILPLTQHHSFFGNLPLLTVEHYGVVGLASNFQLIGWQRHATLLHRVYSVLQLMLRSVTVNWHLSKQSISRDHIAASSLELIGDTCFLTFTAAGFRSDRGLMSG